MLSLCWRASRGRFLLISLTTVILAVAMSHRHLTLRAWPACLAVLAGALLVHAGSNLWNDYADEENGTDRANPWPSPFNGGSRVIQRGELTAAVVKRNAFLCYLGALLLSLALVPRSGWGVPVLTISGVAAAIAYSSPPLHLAGRALGPLVVAVCFGPLLLQGANLVLTGRLSAAAIWPSLPLGLMVGAILALNELPDREPDALAGKVTIAVRYGAKRVIQLYRALLIAAFFALLAAAVFGVHPGWWALLAAPGGAWAAIRAGRLGPRADGDYLRVAAATVLLHTGVGLLLALGYLL